MDSLGLGNYWEYIGGYIVVIGYVYIYMGYRRDNGQVEATIVGLQRVQGSWTMEW